MLRFDPVSLKAWKAKGITEISCFMVARGCAGSKIEVIEGKSPHCDTQININEHLVCWIPQTDVLLFENAFITASGKKWLIKSQAINTRCGCSESFALKTGNPKIDKIALLKLKMKQAKEGVHTD